MREVGVGPGDQLAGLDGHPMLGTIGRVLQHKVPVALQVHHAHPCIGDAALLVAHHVLILVLAMVGYRLGNGQQDLAISVHGHSGPRVHQRKDAVGEPARDGHAPAAGARDRLHGLAVGTAEQGGAVVVVKEAVPDEDAALGCNLLCWRQI